MNGHPQVLDTTATDLKKKRLKDRVLSLLKFLRSRPRPRDLTRYLTSRRIGPAELNSTIGELPVLHWAITYECCVATVEALLDAGCKPTLLDPTGQSAMHVAAASHQVEVVVLLAKRQPELVHGKDKAGWLPLQLAGVNTSWPAVLALTRKGADVNALDGDGTTLVHRASVAGNDVVLSFLIDLVLFCLLGVGGGACCLVFVSVVRERGR